MPGPHILSGHVLQLATSKRYTSEVYYYIRLSGHSFKKQNTNKQTNRKPICQAVLEPSCQIPQNALGFFLSQCPYLPSPRTMAWLHGRARTLAEHTKCKRGQVGVAPTLGLLGSQGQSERRNRDSLEWPSHSAGLWSSTLPSCYPGRSCCPPRPIVWRLEGKISLSRQFALCLSWGSTLHNAQEWKRTMQ